MQVKGRKEIRRQPDPIRSDPNAAPHQAQAHLCGTSGLIRAKFTVQTVLGGWIALAGLHRLEVVSNYSMKCYDGFVGERREILRRVMLETGTTQSELSRFSGVHQPSISQYLSGKVELSDDQLDRLLACMGYRLEVFRRPVVADLTRSERRSWRLHLRISSHLSQDILDGWRPTLTQNLNRLRSSVQGQPHERNLERWQVLVMSGDLSGIHRVLTGLDRDAIEMREVSPFGGLLSPEERSDVLRQAG